MAAQQKPLGNSEDKRRECLLGARVALVPFDDWMVDRYVSWMEDEELRKATGTEALDLDTVRRMQTTWNEGKQMFNRIIVDLRARPDVAAKLEKEGRFCDDPLEHNPEGTVGDIGCFYTATDPVTLDYSTGELSFMIADVTARRKGLMTEALKLTMEFAYRQYQTGLFIAKLLQDNVPSQKLCQAVGFQIESYSSYFKEFTYTCKYSLPATEEGN